MKRLAMIFGGLALLGFAVQVHAFGDAAIDPSGTTAPVTVVDVGADGPAVSGTLINNSSDIARDVQLLVRHTWLWNNERHPGSDSPGRAEFCTVPGPVPPHGNVRFNCPAAPLPDRNDGHFTTEVQVVSFTQVGYAPAPALQGSREF